MTHATNHEAASPIVPDLDELAALGVASGLAEVGVCSAEPFTTTRQVLEDRKAEGLHGGMNFTYRNPARSTEPQRILADAQALVVGAYEYDSDLLDPPEGLHARVARYATDRHYEQLREALQVVANYLISCGWQAVVVLDSNALVDRAAAVRAGLGWYGKNTNVLLPKQGSWFILGSVVTNAPLEFSVTPEFRGCGSCTRCLDDCPTGALTAPGVLDARRCLAWLVQQGGEFPHEYRVGLGDRIYGCDICQEVCPPTIKSDRDRTQANTPQRTTSLFAPGSWVDVIDILTSPEDDLLERYGAWYIPQRDVRYLQRNALIILGNLLATHSGLRDSDWSAARTVLSRYVTSDDDLLNTHAAWAIIRSADSELLKLWGDLEVLQRELAVVNAVEIHSNFHEVDHVAQTEQVTRVAVPHPKAHVS